MPVVVYSNIAKADLREIWDYVSGDSQLQADRLIQRFRAKLEQLAKWNTLGQKFRGIAAVIPLANTASFFDRSTMASRSFG